MAQTQFLKPTNPNSSAPPNAPVDDASEPAVTAKYNNFVDTLPPLDPATQTDTPQSTLGSKPTIFDHMIGGLTNYVKGVGGDYYNMTQSMGQNIEDSGSGKQSLGTGALGVSSDAVKGIFSPVAHALGPITDAAFHGLNNLIDLGKGQKIGTTTANNDADSQAVNAQLQQIAQKHPEGFKNLSSLANLVMAIVGEKGADQTGANLDLGDEAANAKTAIDTAKQLSPGEVADQQGMLHDAAVRAATATLEEAQKSPYQTIKIPEGVDEKTGNSTPESILPRINEGKGTASRTVNSTPLETDAAAALEKSPGFKANVNGTSLEQFNAIQPELIAKNQQLSETLSSHPDNLNSSDIAEKMYETVAKLPDENLGLSTKDPNLKNYIRVFNKAISEIFNKGEDHNMGNDGDLLKLKQKMDAYYKNARGANSAFPQTAANDPQVRALDVLNRSTRDAMTEMLIQNATKAGDVDVAQELKDEWDLHRASDELKNKADNEAPSALGRFAQRHPAIANFGRYMARYGARRAILHP